MLKPQFLLHTLLPHTRIQLIWLVNEFILSKCYVIDILVVLCRSILYPQDLGDVLYGKLFDPVAVMKRRKANMDAYPPQEMFMKVR